MVGLLSSSRSQQKMNSVVFFEDFCLILLGLFIFFFFSTLACILWFPTFVCFYVCRFFFFYYVLFCSVCLFVSRERNKMCGIGMGGWKHLRGVGEGKHYQNMLYGKKFACPWDPFPLIGLP